MQYLCCLVIMFYFMISIVYKLASCLANLNVFGCSIPEVWMILSVPHFPKM